MRHILTSASSLALLLFGAGTVFTTLANTPAFNEDLRKTDVFGREQVALTPSMYDYPDYLLQVATTYVRADLLPSGATEAQDEYASTELAMARASRAIDLLAESIALDPANALTWEQLAWSLVMSGDTPNAKKALRQSWRLAPYNTQMAPLRLDLAFVLFSGEGLRDSRENDLTLKATKNDIFAIIRDLETLRVHSPSDHTFYSQSLEDLL